MQLKMIFLDQESWSIYATINVAVILLLLVICKSQINTRILILISLLGMMKGKLITKLIFTSFLGLLIYRNDLHWIRTISICIMGVIITHHIPEGNRLQVAIMNTKWYLLAFRTIVISWIVLIFYLFSQKGPPDLA